MDRDLQHALQEAGVVLADMIGFLINVGNKSSAKNIPEFADAIRDLSRATEKLGAIPRTGAKVLELSSQWNEMPAPMYEPTLRASNDYHGKDHEI